MLSTFGPISVVSAIRLQRQQGPLRPVAWAVCATSVWLAGASRPSCFPNLMKTESLTSGEIYHILLVRFYVIED